LEFHAMAETSDVVPSVARAAEKIGASVRRRIKKTLRRSIQM
jgi:hypothetical protein